ncbi:YbaY family lipoprotein [Dickeya lacustris]|uniref:YbaY family lipoprotein n=1 Tax=Dickeya lacustris TaxID=2259638 RepID=A0ABY8G5Y3_9GAMM|nr:YbaY family lipoprotein [Dickeya lacustris]WFN55334.1 YbaY family lipoprotein [Dickeya lacustris]
MRLWQLFAGITVSVALSGCANLNSYGFLPPGFAPARTLSLSEPVSGMPAVTGTVNIRQNITLPADAVLTVTVSDASASDAPARVISQRVSRTEGVQAPFKFVLPYNLSDINPDARILLSAVVVINHRITLVTEHMVPVINNGVNNADVNLVMVSRAPSTGKPMRMLAPSPSPAKDEGTGVLLQPY